METPILTSAPARALIRRGAQALAGILLIAPALSLATTGAHALTGLQFPGGCTIINEVEASDSCTFTNLGGDFQSVVGLADPLESVAVQGDPPPTPTYSITAPAGCAGGVSPTPLVLPSLPSPPPPPPPLPLPVIGGFTAGCQYTVTITGNGQVTVFDPSLTGKGFCFTVVVEGSSGTCGPTVPGNPSGYVALAPFGLAIVSVVQPSFANLTVRLIVTDVNTNTKVCDQTGGGIFLTANVACPPYAQTVGHFYTVTASWAVTQINCNVQPNPCPIPNGTVATIEEVDTASA